MCVFECVCVQYFFASPKFFFGFDMSVYGGLLKCECVCECSVNVGVLLWFLLL